MRYFRRSIESLSGVSTATQHGAQQQQRDRQTSRETRIDTSRDTRRDTSRETMAPSGLHLLAIFMVGLSLAHWTENPEEKKFCSWKCLLFVLQWPGSFCVSFDPSECRVPSNISDWTIHGLWPLKEGMCCSCWHIFHSDLKELDSQLHQLWPSLLKNKSSFDFWHSEWRKHGVCAACVEGWNSPQRYFQIILKLRAHYDIQRSLDSAGIKPSCNQTYEHDQIYSVLAPALGDHVVIQCMQDDKVWSVANPPVLTTHPGREKNC
ncbi:ribonuclease T2-like isoform X2 [Hypomesus transpacificus]|uniref:ribonuclease T2-like isoform X2 n=1 Tax=Hypomesus transpacificus TaxID=137520 RepID=UPI001F086488|nr:ribonuclease T2-like isoform X2 [Hypomesus transpacificus]